VYCFSLLEWISTLNAAADNLSKLKTEKKMGLTTLVRVKAMNIFNSILPKVFLGTGGSREYFGGFIAGPHCLQHGQ
jgi:hypothetical protein